MFAIGMLHVLIEIGVEMKIWEFGHLGELVFIITPKVVFEPFIKSRIPIWSCGQVLGFLIHSVETFRFLIWQCLYGAERRFDSEGLGAFQI